MSRIPKFLLLFVLIVFVLACNVVSQPIKNVQNVAGTAESLATSMPDVASTIQSAATNLPGMASTIEAAGTNLPDIGQMFNPHGTPVSEWNGIPIMPGAIAGQEFEKNNYSFKIPGAVKDATDFYIAALPELGWTTTITLPGSDQGAVLLFSKESKFLTVTITLVDGNVVVLLTFV
jgi:hypothetical protein